MNRKNYGYGSYFENGKFYDKDGKEITDIKSFYAACKKKYSKTFKTNGKKKYGYGGDGSYERKEYIEKSSVKIEYPDNLQNTKIKKSLYATPKILKN